MAMLKKPANMTMKTLLQHSRGLEYRDIVVCPSCQSLDLKDKLYIFNPETMQTEITGLCGECEKPFNRTIQLVYDRTRNGKRSSKKES